MRARDDAECRRRATLHDTRAHTHTHMHACMYTYVHPYLVRGERDDAQRRCRERHRVVAAHLPRGARGRCMHARTHVCMHMCMCAYACLPACMCMCVHVCMYVCGYTRMQRLTYAHLPEQYEEDRCIWMYMDAYGCICITFPRSTRKTDAYGCIWMHMDVYGCIWMYMHHLPEEYEEDRTREAEEGADAPERRPARKRWHGAQRW